MDKLYKGKIMLLNRPIGNLDNKNQLKVIYCEDIIVSKKDGEEYLAKEILTDKIIPQVSFIYLTDDFRIAYMYRDKFPLNLRCFYYYNEYNRIENFIKYDGYFDCEIIEDPCILEEYCVIHKDLSRWENKLKELLSYNNNDYQREDNNSNTYEQNKNMMLKILKKYKKVQK